MRPTDLPDPVVPATSKCGMAARSATMGSPAISLPRMIGRLPLASAKAAQAASSLKLTICRSALGNSIPITVLPGMGETRALIALILRAISSARPTTRLALMPGAGSSSYIVTTGPVRTAVISPLTLKSSSTFSSSRALRSSAILSSFTPLSSGGSASRSRLGKSKLANMSRCFALGITAFLGGADGSAIVGDRRGAGSGRGSASGLLARRVLARLSVCAELSSVISRIERSGRRPRTNSGSVSKLRQSIAKTRVVSPIPAARQVTTRPPVTHPDNSSPNRFATASTAPAPSKPEMPPICAGKVLPGPSKMSERKVESSTIAISNMAKGNHQRVVSSSSSCSIPCHNLRAPM